MRTSTCLPTWQFSSSAGDPRFSGATRMVSQKCQYAIRAVFELARRHGQGPVKISDIAEEQTIPLRFLQVILNQLRRGSIVEARRGSEGGYYLSRQPDQVTVGEIVQFIEGPLVPVACQTSSKAAGGCLLHHDCVFMGMYMTAPASRTLSKTTPGCESPLYSLTRSRTFSD
jgi:Rrf2 family cysteine metabolism transcriptional repressor